MGAPTAAPRPRGVCVNCGDEVRADRKGHLWATDPNDGQPLWCDPAPDHRHTLAP